MLAADKLLLESNFKRNAVELKEKELRLHYENFMSISTQAAVLIGFAVSAILELEIPAACPRVLQLAFHLSTVISLVANFQVVACTAIVSVAGTTLALRGPDGSVQKATDNMFKERHNIFRLFAIGLASLHLAAIFASLIKMRAEAALACVAILSYSMLSLANYVQAVYSRLDYEDEDSTSLDEILLGPSFSNAMSKRKLREQKLASESSQDIQANTASNRV